MNNAISTDSSNRAILLISEHTALETRTMKTLTVVALLYAPASFVAVSSVATISRGGRAEHHML